MVNQHYFPASEQQFYSCVLCSEAIYNPLCQGCLNTQLEAWLSSYPDLKKKLTPNLKKFLAKIEDHTIEGLTCISCKDKKASACPYCFTEYVLSQLNKLKVAKHILQEFLVLFNFDYDGKGYTGKEAENFGII